MTANASPAEDRLALIDLVGRWSHAADGGDPTALAALLTDDTELHVEGEDVITGAGDVTERATRAPDDQQLRRHVRNTVVDTIDGDAATTRSYYLLTTSIAGGRPRIVATGVYADRMRRTESGWRISHRHVRPDVSSTSEDQGPVW
jgi:ketosteroid isomerase-like protein